MENTSQAAIRVSKISILVNIFLTLAKLAAGILAGSGAMISDAVHSASDVFSTVVVIIGVKLSGKASDKEHPYGHERMECVAAIILSVILLITGLAIGYEGVTKILSDRDSLAAPGLLAVVAAIVSILAKELLFQYVRRWAKKLDSTALMAEAWHHRSDALRKQRPDGVGSDQQSRADILGLQRQQPDGAGSERQSRAWDPVLQ